MSMGKIFQIAQTICCSVARKLCRYQRKRREIHFIDDDDDGWQVIYQTTSLRTTLMIKFNGGLFKEKHKIPFICPQVIFEVNIM